MPKIDYKIKRIRYQFIIVNVEKTTVHAVSLRVLLNFIRPTESLKPSCVAAASYRIPIMAMFPEFYVMEE